MSCQNNAQTNPSHTTRTGAGYIIIIVLYILLAIIIGSGIWN